MRKRYGIALFVVVAIASLVATWMHKYKKANQAPYLSVYGPVVMRDGIGRQAVELIQTIKDEVSVNFISTQPINYTDVPKSIIPLIKAKAESKRKAKVVILEDVVWLPDNPAYKKLVRSTTRDQIRIAYSMIESTAIPDEWVLIFNSHFDAVAVPDRFLIDVYKNSGVKIPVFEVPLGLYLDEYLDVPLRKVEQRPFVFGCLGACIERKNHLRLVRAFAKAFGNREDVCLKMNCRNGDSKLMRAVKEEIDRLGLKNIQFTNITLDHVDYFKLFNSLDCLVSLSQGEGFSIQPREAMALGIPAIVTNNTAQTTICESGFVRAVDSLIPEKASYFWGMSYGERFDCTLEDAAEALLDVYHHYDTYLEKAKGAREWVKQYQYKNLKKKYLNLVKPAKVILGDRDEITEDYLMTTSEELYKKYKKI